LGYVVSGSVHFEVEGQAALFLRAGDAFYEPANVNVPHFDNASQTDGMSFVAFYLMAGGSEEKVKIL
jgi:quercetin dioxygenase-like cupin family protein